MTYENIELSEYDGAPVELFKFAHDSDTWLYSSGEETTHDSETYAPAAIGREGDISITSEPNQAGISVAMPIDLGVSQLFLAGSPENIVTLTIFRLHEPSGVYEIYWKGQVVSCSWNEGQAKAECESIFAAIKRMGLRGRYTRGCRHALYSDACGVNKSEYAVACTVTAVSGLVVSFTVDDSTEYDDDYFTAGMLYAAGAWRFVVAHSTGAVTIMDAVDLEVDDAFTLYPGCNHSITTCVARFDNVLNYGGFPWIPSDNPFNGSLI